jgi:hypothetical protein
MASYPLHSGRHTAAGLVRLAGTALALVLTGHILFVLFTADPTNPVVSWASRWSDVLGLWFTDLFHTGSPGFTVVLNYGAAAVFWLVVTGVLASVLRSVG